MSGHFASYNSRARHGREAVIEALRLAKLDQFIPQNFREDRLHEIRTVFEGAFDLHVHRVPRHKVDVHNPSLGNLEIPVRTVTRNGTNAANRLFIPIQPKLAAHRAGLAQIPAWVREMDDDTAFMQLVLSNAQGELSHLERGMHALAATEKGKHNGRSVDAYALATGTTRQTLQSWIYAAEVYQIATQVAISPRDVAERTRHLSEIHAAQKHCWQALVERLVKDGWSKEQTIAAVKAVLAVRPPRGYEKLFAVEKPQEMAAAGQDANEATRLAVRACPEFTGAASKIAHPPRTSCAGPAGRDPWARISELTHSAYRYTLWM